MQSVLPGREALMNKLRNWGIRSRVIFLAMTPVLVVTFVLAVYINTARHNDLRQELAERGQLMTEQLASSMEFAVATGNVAEIKRLANISMQQDIVAGIKVSNPQDGVIYTTGTDQSDRRLVKKYSASIISTALEEEIYASSKTAFDQHAQTLGHVDVYITSEPYIARQQDIYLTTVLISVVGLLGSLGLALLIGRSVTRPMQDVTATVESLTHGALDARMHDESGGELGKLRDGLNAMAETLQNSQTELKNKVDEAVAELQSKLGELESKNIELNQAREEAMLARDAKSKFLAHMSHEIRTPLNAIIGFTRQLGKTLVDTRQEAQIRAVTRAAKQLQTVIDDILSFSKVESNAINLVSSQFPLRETMEDIVLMLSHSASEKMIEMVLLIDEDIPDVVLGDPDRVSQVIINLVNNAIKFTDQGSVVLHVRHEMEDDPLNIHFHVKDTGCGISDDAKRNIFSPFYQEDHYAASGNGGTGLGLAISKSIVEMMGGKIGFSSEKGVGSEFHFYLPLAVVSQRQAQVTDRALKVFLLDQHTQSRRAIRNTLVHMGIETFAVEKIDRLIKLIQASDTYEESDIVILSLPAGYRLTDLGQEYLEPVREYFAEKILVLHSSGDFTTEDIPGLDDHVDFMMKPLRSHSFLEMMNLLDRHEPEDAIHQYSPQQQAATASHTILVAEDNELNRQYMRTLLSGYSLEVIFVEDGDSAVTACRKGRFDMVLMDLHMPGLDGIKAAQQIRDLPGEVANTPIIAITADVFANDDGALIEQGFDDYLLKPLDENELDKVIETFIGPADLKKAHVLQKDDSGETRLPADMEERLFTNLHSAYEQLAQAIGNRDVARMHEITHEILGLASYFKVDNLVDDIRQLQDAINQTDFAGATALLETCIRHTRQLQRNAPLDNA
jgi:two-component system sensor histidine kinase BarA